MDPTCTKGDIMQNPRNSWNPRRFLEVPNRLQKTWIGGLPEI
jgi:hypothetical protein